MLNHAAPNVLIPVGFRGLSGWCTGWAGDSAGTVYASFIGRKTALEGIWAAFQSHEALQLLDTDELRKRMEPEAAHYHTLRAHLPETGWQHLVLLHSQATVNNLHDENFYLISEAGDPPLARFLAQWNNALPLPARPEWVTVLWQEGIAAGLISPCAAQGIYCWRVQADRDTWGSIVALIVQDAKRRAPPCSTR